MKDMSKKMELMHKQIETLWLDRQVFDMNKKMELMQHHIEVLQDQIAKMQEHNMQNFYRIQKLEKSRLRPAIAAGSAQVAEVAPEYMSPVQTRKRPASAAPPVHLPEPPGR